MKLIKTTRNKRSGGCILQSFVKKYLQNFKYNIKRACIFQLTLGGILSIFILLVNNREGVLNGQNPLSVTKVTCR